MPANVDAMLRRKIGPYVFLCVLLAVVLPGCGESSLKERERLLADLKGDRVTALLPPQAQPIDRPGQDDVGNLLPCDDDSTDSAHIWKTYSVPADSDVIAYYREAFAKEKRWRELAESPDRARLIVRVDSSSPDVASSRKVQVQALSLSEFRMDLWGSETAARC